MAHESRLVSVIMNEGSGHSDSAKLRQTIDEAFAAQSIRVVHRSLPEPPTPRNVERLVRRAEGLVVVAGGDGTVNAVASACRSAGRPFGIIAAGTFNYVARNLGLPTDVAEAAKAIATGKPVAVPAGEVNGWLFLNNAGFGLYSHLIEQREIDKQRFGRHQLVAFLSGLRVLAHRNPVHDIRIETDGHEQKLRTTTLFFGVNALQLRNYNIEAAECVARGRLALLSLRFDSRLDIAAAAWAALRGNTQSAHSVDATCAKTVRVVTRRRSLKVAIDGEIVRVKPPLIVRYVPDALQVVMTPPEAADATDAGSPANEVAAEAAANDAPPSAAAEAAPPSASGDRAPTPG